MQYGLRADVRRPTSTRTARTSSSTSPSTTSRCRSPRSPRTSTSRASSRASTTSPTRPRLRRTPRVQLLASGVGFPWITRGRSGCSPRTGAWPPTPGRSPRGTSWPATPSPPRSGTCCHPGEEPAHAVRHRQARRTPRARSSRCRDYMRAVPLQIARWVPGDYHVLGADGFGFADTRPAARRFFHDRRRSRSSCRRSQALADAGEIEPREGRGGVRRSTASTTRPPSPTSSRRAATPEPPPDVAARGLERRLGRSTGPRSRGVSRLSSVARPHADWIHRPAGDDVRRSRRQRPRGVTGAAARPDGYVAAGLEQRAQPAAVVRPPARSCGRTSWTILTNRSGGPCAGSGRRSGSPRPGRSARAAAAVWRARTGITAVVARPR